MTTAGKTGTPSDLREASGQVVEDFIAGRWGDLIGRPMSEVRVFLLSELLGRCTSFSTRDYRAALNTALSLRNHALRVRQLTGKKALTTSRKRDRSREPIVVPRPNEAPKRPP